MEKELSCAFTGHRPSSFRFGYDEEHSDCGKIKALMTTQVLALMQNGVKTFLTGMALGVDMWGAEIVLARATPYNERKKLCCTPAITNSAGMLWYFECTGTLNQAVKQRLSARYRFASANII